MKTLCVSAAVVLSLISVCRAASLACQKLVNPGDKDPEISGTWHYIAFSTGHCLNSTLFNELFWPNAALDITAKGTPNIYDGNVKVKVFGKCINESMSFHYANHSIFHIDRNNASAGEGTVLLQTGCPDCLVVKGGDAVTTLTLFSRRKSVDAAELKEFEEQAQCLGWSKPQVLNTDHDYENCPSLDHDDFKAAAAAFKFLLCMGG